MYAVNRLPKQDAAGSPTGCCAEVSPKDWDEQTFRFKDKLFTKVYTRNFLHVPLNMGSVMTKAMAAINGAGASMGDEYIILSYDASAWKGEHYLSVDKDIPGQEMVKLSGEYLAKVFEGPYKEAGKWYQQMIDYAKEKGKIPGKIYFYYTTCPKCAKVYGKNYVIGFAELK